MDKTYQTELRRTFLITGLPEPLLPASSHLQIFDNYIVKTRIRLRSIRVPEENHWTRILEQRFAGDDLASLKSVQIYLNDEEYKVFELFKGREIRKNRYYYELDDRQLTLDIYLGKLWGLNMMTATFEDAAAMEGFQIPQFVHYEVTREAFFMGENLVTKTFADVQAEFARIRKTQ